MDELITSIRVFGQHLPHGVLEQYRCAVQMFGEGGWCFIENSAGRLHRGILLERMNACDHLVEHHSTGEHVGSGIRFFPSGLLWGHISESSQRGPCLGQAGGEGLFLGVSSLYWRQPLGQPKIQHLDVPLGGDHDVRRLQIPMNDVLPVGGF